MNKKVKIRNILLFLFVLVLAIAGIEFFVRPYERLNFNFVYKFLDKIHQSQNIAPSRLFVKAWRTAKIEYVDKSMNNQDWYRWRMRYANKIKTLDDANVAINSILASLNDPYTKFLQSKSFSKQKVIMDSKITGVGVLLNKSGDEVVVNHILKNSSAQNENIMEGDSIISINGVSVKDMSLDDIHKYIENIKDKKITLQIKRGDEIIIKKLERKEISIDTMSYKITKGNIGIIKLDNIMGEKALKDFKEILVKTNSTKGIIIDLRNNYGGILANAIQMADCIITNEKIVGIESRGSLKLQIYADEETYFTQKPIVILVNSKTASAAEILAGALHCSAGAVMLGENTYGKNSIQQVIPMANNSGMIITSDKYILPNGEDIHNTGIKPDYVYEKFKDENGKDMLIRDAVKLINELVKNQK